MTPRNRLVVSSLLLLTVLVQTACDPAEQTASLTGVSVTPATITLSAGGTQQLTVTGTYSDGSTKSLTANATFASDTPATATVSSPGGLVTAVAAGTARITATVSGKTASTSVTVSASSGPTLSSIALSPSPASVVQGSTLQLTVTGTYSDDSTQSLTADATFSSSAEGIATVSASGVVTGVSVGSATITASVGGKTATLNVSVMAQPDANQVVFFDGNGTDVTFADFGGAANNVTVDSTETFSGRKVINFQVTGTGNYSGGAWVTSTPRDLSAYNALTFWAKASKVEKINVTGIGNNAGIGSGTGFGSERTALELTTQWQKFTIPIPNPARYKNVGGLFHVADGPDGYTLYLADVIYEHLGTGILGAGTASIGNGNAITASVATAGTYSIEANQNQVVFTVAGDPGSPVTVKPVANTFFDFTSTDAAIASVNSSGVVTGVSAGGPVTISATLGGVAASGSYAITVTGVLSQPTTLPPAPTHAAGDTVYSLYSSVTGGYTGTASDQSAKIDTWLTGWSAGSGGAPFTITTDAGSAAPRKYVFTNLANFVGVEFYGTAGAYQVDAAGRGLTKLHLDLWTPDNATNFQVKLVDFGANGAFGGNDDTEGTATITATSTPPLATGAWLSYELTLATDFQGLANMHHLAQMVLVAPNGGTVFLDNIYFHP
ncbi:beta strand repeat-containing protein [Archangium lansingense]|uniref:Ig-like domain-containing protein n=1 Tax=Archangium lansingense TaxID=2995310 RepID=A0ABT4A3Z7_9BACT|nr:Ig-like domain-containing protein [Archangium lansinium]MCY1076346.1 Ig-like domain-containing protein [Archangium lansinium]